MLRNIIVLALAAAVLTGCDNAQVRTTLDTSLLTYAKDRRTNLCFATIGRSDNAVGVTGSATSLSMTHVPCTPEVEALIR